MHQHPLQSPHAVPQRRQMHHPVAKVAHIQFHADPDQPGVSSPREHLDRSTQYNEKIQMHSICLGAVELSPKDEERHTISDIITIRKVLQLLSKV